MAGETRVLEQAFDNIALSNVQPYQLVVQDTANSGPIVTAAKLPAASGGLQPLGIAYDQAKLDPTGAVAAGSGMNVRISGVARAIADAAISAGAFLQTSAITAGQVHTLAQAGAGVQPKPTLGFALTSASAQGDRILVVLTPGLQY